MANRLAKMASERFTAVAQELVTARADLGVSSQERIIEKTITQNRMEKIGKELGEKDPAKAVEKVKEKIATERKSIAKKVEKSIKKIADSQESLNEIDDMIDSLLC